jgi:membrane-associated phospholipid phosphatase
MLLLGAAAVIWHSHGCAQGAAFPSEPAQWRLWLAHDAATDTVAPTLVLPAPAPATLEPVWLERWGRLPPAIAWNDTVIDLIVKYQQNPLRATRAMALMHAAMHDALVLCARARCGDAATRVALHAAASRTLRHLYPQESPGRFDALALSASRAVAAAHSSDAKFQDGWRVGHAAARAAIARALDDGADLARDLSIRPAARPGMWRATPPMNIHDPTEPRAGEWRPWVLSRAAEFEPPPPVSYGSAAYWAEVDEVRRTAAALTPRQKQIAEAWNLDLGTVTPAGVWNRHARRVALARRLDVAETTRLYATLNVAMMDAFIACWHAKLKWWTQRPVTAIRDKFDTEFLPYLLTPPFPGYVSGHACASGAASAVLSALFTDEAPQLARDADEAAQSRLYGGIHFKSDNVEGLKLGQRVGTRVVLRLQQN